MACHFFSGSTHTILGPYWSEELGKKEMRGRIALVSTSFLSFSLGSWVLNLGPADAWQMGYHGVLAPALDFLRQSSAVALEVAGACLCLLKTQPPQECLLHRIGGSHISSSSK